MFPTDNKENASDVSEESENIAEFIRVVLKKYLARALFP